MLTPQPVTIVRHTPVIYDTDMIGYMMVHCDAWVHESRVRFCVYARASSIAKTLAAAWCSSYVPRGILVQQLCARS